MWFILLFFGEVASQITSGRIGVINLLPKEIQNFQIQFEGVNFPFPPQITFALVGIRIEGDLPKKLVFQPKAIQVTKIGFKFTVQGGSTILDYLEYQWMAINDDRVKLACSRLEENQLGDCAGESELAKCEARISFERYFAKVPLVNVYLTGVTKISNTADLNFGVVVQQIDKDSFLLGISKKSAHSIQAIDLCYVAGPEELIQTRAIPKLDQQADEFIDLEGTSEANLILFGLTRLSHHYGILMIQLGEAQTQFETKAVGINQMDLIMTELDFQEFVNCPIGYFHCDFEGMPIYLCGPIENWSMLKSLRLVKGGPRALKVSENALLNLEQGANCIKNIHSFITTIDTTTEILQQSTNTGITQIVTNPKGKGSSSKEQIDEVSEETVDQTEEETTLENEAESSEEDDSDNKTLVMQISSKGPSSRLEELLRASKGDYYSKYETKVDNPDLNHCISMIRYSKQR